MENIALGKGLRLKPYKPRGVGLRLKPYLTPTTKWRGIKNRKKNHVQKKNFDISLTKRALTNVDINKYAKKLKIPYIRGVYTLDTLPISQSGCELWPWNPLGGLQKAWK